MQQRKGGFVFALAVGLVVAFVSYQWITDPGPREERARQEAAVRNSRAALEEFVAAGPLEIVDPLAPRRRVGKVYVYPLQAGWEVSGYYRRDEQDLWHPYLVVLDADLQLVALAAPLPLLPFPPPPFVAFALAAFPVLPAAVPVVADDVVVGGCTPEEPFCFCACCDGVLARFCCCLRFFDCCL